MTGKYRLCERRKKELIPFEVIFYDLSWEDADAMAREIRAEGMLARVIAHAKECYAVAQHAPRSRAPKSIDL
jgi:hypothetical protein